MPRWPESHAALGAVRLDERNEFRAFAASECREAAAHDHDHVAFALHLLAAQESRKEVRPRLGIATATAREVALLCDIRAESEQKPALGWRVLGLNLFDADTVGAPITELQVTKDMKRGPKVAVRTNSGVGDYGFGSTTWAPPGAGSGADAGAGAAAGDSNESGAACLPASNLTHTVANGLPHGGTLDAR